MKKNHILQKIIKLLICIVCILTYSNMLFSQNKTICIQGCVFTREEKKLEPIINASVQAFKKDSILLNATITDNNGNFHLNLNSLPSKIIIRYIGYDIYKVTNFNNKKSVIQMDTCFLSSNNILAETVVKASNVSHKIGSDVYLITKTMKDKAANTLELLDQMHGLKYDKLSNSIKINNSSSILFLVDNKEQSKDYIMNLNPERISKIEVNKNPKGKYMSEGYEAIINIILKKEYQGSDINISNFMVANLGNNNGSDNIITDQPYINIVYTKKKINFFANYIYGYARWNSTVEKKVLYDNTFSMLSTSIKNIKPNDLYSYHGNVISGGLNYNISSNHTLSFETDYSKEIKRDDVDLNYTTTDLVNKVESDLSNEITNKTGASNFTSTLFYNGKINERFSIYSDISYNNYHNDVFNKLLANKESNSNNYFEKRHLFKFNVESKYVFSDKMNISFGCSTDFHKYTSDTSTIPFLYKEFRYKAFTYFQYKPMEKLEIEAGIGGEQARIKQDAEHKTFSKLLPSFLINYNVSDNFNFKASYLTNMEYPMLSQLNPATTFIDNYLQQKGNSSLKSNLSHSFSIDFNLWNKITITPQLKIAPQMICDLISKNNSQFINSFYNVNYKEYSLQFVYDQPIGKYFNFSNNLSYYHSKAKYDNIKKNTNGWLLDSEINYTGKNNLLMQLGYHKNMDKQNRVQGYQMYNFDSWTFSLNKKLFHDKISFMLMYMLPFKLGVKNLQEKKIQTPNYTETYNIDMKPYQNTLVFKLTYSFHKGNIKMKKSKSSIERNERINRTVDF